MTISSLNFFKKNNISIGEFGITKLLSDLEKKRDNKKKEKKEVVKVINKPTVDKKIKNQANGLVKSTKEVKLGYKNPKYWHNKEWKAGIRIIGATKYEYKSSYEANYARYLEYMRLRGMIKGWQYEVDIFRFEKVKRGLKGYLPDFKVFLPNGKFEYHEVKGYMDSKAKTKLKRFAQYYPQHTLKVIDGTWFKEFKKSGVKLDGWED